MNFFYILIFPAFLLTYFLFEEESQESEKLNTTYITAKCIGEICLENKVGDLRNHKNIRFREAEFQSPNSTYIDSVVFIEYQIDNEVLAYSRIPLDQISDNKEIYMVVTESEKLETPNGVKVGMKFKELNKIIPGLKIGKRPFEYLSKGQYLERVKISNTSVSLIVVNYEEVEIENGKDTIVTSISIHLNQ
jgi:hypothetical protein